MKLRSILIFPQFGNIEIIEAIRRKYDPLVSLIKPHITLVFPFESEISNSTLEQLVEKTLKDLHPFPIELTGYSKHSDNFGHYLSLNVTKGMDHIREIHELLYAELKISDSGFPYMPHLTVGKLPSAEQLDFAYKEIADCKDIFQTTVDKISVEVIGGREESIVLFEKKLF